MPEAAHRYGKRLIYENPSFEVPPARDLELLGRNSTGEITTIDIQGAYLGPEPRPAGVRRLFDGARYRRLFVECLRDYTRGEEKPIFLSPPRYAAAVERIVGRLHIRWGCQN